MIKDNVLELEQRIKDCCFKANRDPASITLVAVSKGRALDEIKEAIDSGITNIGENRLQEAMLKYQKLPAIDYRLPTIRWHFVGHLQSNKAREAVKIFDLIHSVDSLSLAKELNKQAAKINKIQDVLLEINTSCEKTKFGFEPDKAVQNFKDIAKLKNVRVKGLMTIAPLADNPQDARPFFKMLREIQDEINRLSPIGYRLSTLSMGMSDDYKVAIEEGSNIIRLGRAVFGD